MEENMNSINIEEIMREIRNEISEKSYTEDNIDFEDIINKSSNECLYNELEWNENLYMMNRTNEIAYYKELPKGIKSFIKRIIRKMATFLMLPIVEQQSSYNAYTVRCMNQLDLFTKEMHNINELQERKSNKYIQLVKGIENRVEILNNKIQETEKKSKELDKKIQDLDHQSQALGIIVNALGDDKKVEDISGLLNTVVENIRNNNSQISQLESSKEMVNAKLNILLENKNEIENSAKKDNDFNIPIKTKRSEYSSIDYFDFENYFRGSREEIKNAQSQYLKYYEGKNNVLDLGCGRGEFLEILKENKINAVGVDLYDVYVNYCTEKGLDVKVGDAVKYLASCDKVDGIFCSQLIEHLKLDQIIELCRLAYEKLEDSSYLVIETPNPMSLAIFTHSFYIDPSHKKPVHPYTMQYLLKKAGFSNIEIVFTESSKLLKDVPKINIDGNSNYEELNNSLSTIWNTLYGSQDYAIIAQK